MLRQFNIRCKSSTFRLLCFNLFFYCFTLPSAKGGIFHNEIDFMKSVEAAYNHRGISRLNYTVVDKQNNRTTLFETTAMIFDARQYIDNKFVGTIIGFTSGHFFKKFQDSGLPVTVLNCLPNLIFNEQQTNFVIRNYAIHPRYLELSDKVSELDPELVKHDLALFKVSFSDDPKFLMSLSKLHLPTEPMANENFVDVLSYGNPFIMKHLSFEKHCYPQLKGGMLNSTNHQLKTFTQNFKKMLITWNVSTGMISRDILPIDNGINFIHGDSGSVAIDPQTQILHGIYSTTNYQDMLCDGVINKLYNQYFKADHRQVGVLDHDSFQDLVHKMRDVAQLSELENINGRQQLLLEFQQMFSVIYHFAPIYENLDFIRAYFDHINHENIMILDKMHMDCENPDNRIF